MAAERAWYAEFPPPYADVVDSTVKGVFRSLRAGTQPGIVFVSAEDMLLMGYDCKMRGREGNVLVSIGNALPRARRRHCARVVYSDHGGSARLR